MKKTFLAIAIAAILFKATPAWAQSLAVGTTGGRCPWELDIRGGLNNDGWFIDCGMAWFPTSFTGVKASIGLDSEIKELGDWGQDDWETGHSYAARFRFTPAVVLRTPPLLHWKRQNGTFHLFAEPGMVISPGSSGSKGARTVCWDFKGGINLQIDQFVVSAGYGISNFSLYSGNPHNHWGLPGSDSHITHCGFIGTAYKF